VDASVNFLKDMDGRKGYGVSFGGLGQREHLIITVFDKDGNLILE